MSDFLLILKELTQRSYITILLFDEIDQIITDNIEIKNWGNLFSALNRSKCSVLTIIFSPRDTIEKLLSKDPRLERWTTDLHTNSLPLPGKYGTNMYRGVANILAMYSKQTRSKFTDSELKFIYDILKYQEDFLIKANLRTVNTKSIIICEMLAEYQRVDIWDKWERFISNDKATMGKIIEKKLKLFYRDLTMKTFRDVPEEDNDDEVILRYEYIMYNLTAPQKISDGYFQQYKKLMNHEVKELQIAVEIKFTTEEDHSSNQILDVFKLAEAYPTILFSLGPDKEVGEKIVANIIKRREMNKKIKPIYVISSYASQIIN